MDGVASTFASRRSANRRRRDEARQQIVETARRELKVKPFRELTVDELMEGTGLSRTAFYRYFPDRESVLVDLLEEAWAALVEARDQGRMDGTAPPSSMAQLARLLGEHRGVLKAISDAAAGDGDMERTYRAFMQSCWIDDLTSRLVDAQAEGRAAGLDPHLGGEALGWMAERMVTQSLDRDPGQVLDTIVTILVRCIFDCPPDPPTAPVAADSAPTS